MNLFGKYTYFSVSSREDQPQFEDRPLFLTFFAPFLSFRMPTFCWLSQSFLCLALLPRRGTRSPQIGNP